MKKKEYNQPVVELVKMKSHGIICTSGLYGGSSENAGEGSETIEVP